MNDSITVNLIPRARRIEKRRRSRIRRWAGAVIAYSLCVALAVGGLGAVAANDDRVAAGQLAAVAEELAKSEAAAKKLRIELSRVRSLYEASHAVGRQPNWSVLLALLAHTVGDEVVLRSCRLEPNVRVSTKTAPSTDQSKPSDDSSKPAPQSFTLSLIGLGKSQPAVSQFVLRLEQAGIFSQVRLVETRREPFLDDEAVGFKLECALGSEREGRP